MQLMQARARRDGRPLCFIGAGAYEHHIPAGGLVHGHARRVLQRLYALPGGGQPGDAAEHLRVPEHDRAASPAWRSATPRCTTAPRRWRRRCSWRCAPTGGRQRRASWCRATCIRTTARVALATACNQGVKFEELPYAPATGQIAAESLAPFAGQDITALVIQQPNFFGVLEDVDALTDWAHARGALVIARGESDLAGAAEAAGQRGGRAAPTSPSARASRSGCPLSSGGPYFGFMSTRMEHVRQMPGRHRRAHARSGRPARLHADAAGARAAHPPRQGDVQHLHQPGPADAGRHDLSVAAGRRRDSSAWRRCRCSVPSSWRAPWRDRRACDARSTARAFTRRCWRSTARWRRCWRRWASAASRADSIWRALPGARDPRCWCAPPRPRPAEDLDAYARALAEVLRRRGPPEHESAAARDR